MAFKLKAFADLVGIDKDTSEWGTPVFEKELGGTIMGEANNDGTIFIDKGLSKSEKQKVVDHEKIHKNQMGQNKLYYDDNFLTWKKDTKSPARVYKRVNGNLIDIKTGKGAEEGGDFEWEREAYKNS